MPGVVSWVSASDIPGVNSVTGLPDPSPNSYSVLEEIFATTRSHYAGQAVGLVVADTRDRARKAARRVWGESFRLDSICCCCPRQCCSCLKAVFPADVTAAPVLVFETFIAAAVTLLVVCVVVVAAAAAVIAVSDFAVVAVCMSVQQFTLMSRKKLI